MTLIGRTRRAGVETLTLDSPHNRNALSAALVGRTRRRARRTARKDTARPRGRPHPHRQHLQRGRRPAGPPGPGRPGRAAAADRRAAQAGRRPGHRARPGGRPRAPRRLRHRGGLHGGHLRLHRGADRGRPRGHLPAAAAPHRPARPRPLLPHRRALRRGGGGPHRPAHGGRATTWTPYSTPSWTVCAGPPPRPWPQTKRLLTARVLEAFDRDAADLTALSARLFASAAGPRGDDGLPGTTGSRMGGVTTSATGPNAAQAGPQPGHPAAAPGSRRGLPRRTRLGGLHGLRRRRTRRRLPRRRPAPLPDPRGPLHGGRRVRRRGTLHRPARPVPGGAADRPPRRRRRPRRPLHRARCSAPPSTSGSPPPTRTSCGPASPNWRPASAARPTASPWNSSAPTSPARRTRDGPGPPGHGPRPGPRQPAHGRRGAPGTGGGAVGRTGRDTGLTAWCGLGRLPRTGAGAGRRPRRVGTGLPPVRSRVRG